MSANACYSAAVADSCSTIEHLFHEALTFLPEERRRYLDEACQGNDDLRREVEALLERDSAGSLLSRSSILRLPVELALDASGLGAPASSEGDAVSPHEPPELPPGAGDWRLPDPAPAGPRRHG